jgi:hypothetical protein
LAIGILVGRIQLPIESGDESIKPKFDRAVRDTHIDNASAGLRAVSCECPDEAGAPVVAGPDSLIALQVGEKGEHIRDMPFESVARTFSADDRSTRTVSIRCYSAEPESGEGEKLGFHISAIAGQPCMKISSGPL